MRLLTLLIDSVPWFCPWTLLSLLPLFPFLLLLLYLLIFLVLLASSLHDQIFSFILQSLSSISLANTSIHRVFTH